MKVFNKEQGFTLIELMITVTIMAIIIAMAAPSFQGSIRRARVDAAANSLRTGFATARAEAIQRGRTVGICASPDPSLALACGLGAAGLQGGWIVFVDNNNNGAYNVGEELKVGGPSAVNIGGDGNILLSVGGTALFDRRGMMVTPAGAPAPQGTLTVNAAGCTTGVEKQLTLTIGTAGRTSMNTVEQTCP